METVKDLGAVLSAALRDTAIPKLYANGFVNALGGGDSTILLQRNGEPIAVLNLSYSLAKTLAVKLSAMIKELEEKTGNKIMTSDDIQISLNPKKEVV